ncbi:alkene reductase [Pseudoalteromonas galatheae]|uniref:alkene reductase n=1 Tax=Pseudoalteromonas galatheae TaxID=579562 RepID=UPI0030D4F5CA
MSDPLLFTQKKLGNLILPNRILMAPMTRSRTTQPGDIPNQLMAKYYAQRASAGLIISEATQISCQGKGYSFTPGIYTASQVAGWKEITHAVQQKGGRIFCQLWHVGRMSHSTFHEDDQPVAPSALAPDAQVWVVNEKGVGEMVDCPTPRALATQEIQSIVEDYVHAAENAMMAGFNGVEIHAGNGYLIDQFLRRSSNQRHDQYGGSKENRIRFAVEVITAISQAIGPEKVGIRLAPFITQRGMQDEEAIDTILLAAEHFNRLGIAYVHLAEADWDDAPVVTESFRQALRRKFHGAIIVAGNYEPEQAEALIEQGLVDFVAFGRKFISNPDLVYRLTHQLPLSPINPDAPLFGGSEQGYTDYADFQQLRAKGAI